MAETRYNHPVLGEVTLSQTRRATRISIAVRRRDPVQTVFSDVRIGTQGAVVSRNQSQLDRVRTAASLRTVCTANASFARRDRGDATQCQSRPSGEGGTFRAAVRIQIRTCNDTCHTVEVGLMFGRKQHLAEPLSDEGSGASA